MKKYKFKNIILAVILILSYESMKAQEKWTIENANKWLSSAEWQKKTKLKVYAGIDAAAFATQYHLNKDLWDAAFKYLNNKHPDTIANGKYYLKGDSLIVIVSDNKTKAFEDTKWEAHRKYIDIQYIAKGKEKMGVAPIDKGVVAEPYDDKKDVGFYTFPENEGKFYIATPDTFLIFFPKEAHRPNIKTGDCSVTKKIVIKLLAADTQSKVKVGLDNWFNRETNKKTGLPYHYLWSDTAWSGYSRWGKIFTEKGAEIFTLEKPAKEVLSKVDIFIIVDPDTTSENPAPNYIETKDADVIESWVRDGGVLIILANDAPNCEFTHLNQLSSRFGIIFNHVTRHPVINNNWDMGAFTALPEHPLFSGVGKIYLKEISSLKISEPATPVLTENGEIFMAESKIGKGFVFAVGDPWIYNEYIDHDRLPADFDNHKAAENLSVYLIKQSRYFNDKNK
jgi:YhcH/YjgK/YiaL family protein